MIKKDVYLVNISKMPKGCVRKAPRSKSDDMSIEANKVESGEKGGEEGELCLQRVCCGWQALWAVQLLRPNRDCQRGSKLRR